MNVMERSEIAASDVTCASELDESPALNVSITGKAEVVAEMVEYAFEGSNHNPGTRVMVANLRQFLSKQYEEDTALAVIKIERLKEEHLKEKMKLVFTLGEQSKLAYVENLKSSDDLIHKKELHMGPTLEKMKKKAAVDGSSLSMFESTRKPLNVAIIFLGKTLDSKLKALFPGGGDPKASQEINGNTVSVASSLMVTKSVTAHALSMCGITGLAPLCSTTLKANLLV